MALEEILVQIDDSEPAESRMQYAAEVSRVHGAHLIGVYRSSEPVPDAYLDAAYMDADGYIEELDRARRRITEHAEQAEALFRRVTDGAGLSAEWRSREAHFSYQLLGGAPYADLVITGQPDPSSRGRGLAERFILDAGRPTLVIPYIGAPDTVAHNVLVAWDESREAARAVHDALPLLSRAESVNILCVVEDEGENEGAIAEGRGEALRAHLARHGVDGAADHAPRDGMDVVDVLLSRAAELGSDLLVMGAYGHSRLREIVLGGATRDVLRSMTIPVLFSH